MSTAYRESIERRHKQIVNREAHILRVARRLLKAKGYIGLTMDLIAQAARLSKATLYRHFTSKEEVIMGLAIENARQRVAYTKQASGFAGRARERFVAVRVFAQRVYPSHLAVELILYTNAIRAKTSSELQEALFAEEAEVFRLMAGIVQDAIDTGDLTLPAGATAEELAFSAWALFFGGFTLRVANIPLERCLGPRGDAAQAFLVRYAGAALDGLGWRPLSTEWDYTQTQQRVVRTFDLKGA